MPDIWPPYNNVELQINTACNTNCFGCDRFSDVIHDIDMTLEQVNLFVEESLDLNWEWKRIRLLGGEPTLHPRFVEMVESLVFYRETYPKVFLQILTNGIKTAKYLKYEPWLKDLNISFHAEAKEKGVTPAWFHNTRIVPIDRDPSITELPPCGIYGVNGCGIGLTPWGYFLDGAGASVARVAGYDIGIMHLKDVTWESMEAQAKVVCAKCGHWNPDNSKVTELVSKTGKVTGKFMTEKIAEFKKQKPIMRVYGKD